MGETLNWNSRDKVWTCAVPFADGMLIGKVDGDIVTILLMDCGECVSRVRQVYVEDAGADQKVRACEARMLRLLAAME